jgi:hypothetical protein
VSYSILRLPKRSGGDRGAVGETPEVADGLHRYAPALHGGYSGVANLALQHLPPPGSLYAKLTVSDVGDPTETQADRIADEVMRSKADIRPGGATESGIEPRQGGRIEGFPLSAGIPGSPQSASSVPDGFIRGLGPGQPIDPVARRFFEPRFGRDLGDIRLHTSAAASQAASAVRAKAFTVGPHIAFAADYDGVHTDGGKRLLAHEIAHVIQQGNHRTPGTQGVGHRLDRKVTIDAKAWGDDAGVSLEPWYDFVPEGIDRTLASGWFTGQHSEPFSS